MEVDFCPHWTFGHIWRDFWLSPLRGATGIYVEEARETAKHPTNAQDRLPHNNNKIIWLKISIAQTLRKLALVY